MVQANKSPDGTSKVTITITSREGADHIDVQVAFDPPAPGPAARNSRSTPAQQVATRMLEAVAEQVQSWRDRPRA